MAGISAYDSNSISILFSSLPGASNGGVSPMSAMSASIMDYNMVKSGNYLRLMKSYFAKTDADEFRKAFGNSKTGSNSVSKDSASTLSNMKDATDALGDAATELVRGTAFNKVTETDENGKTVSTYDTDKIYKAVKSFADNYNRVVKAADGVNSSSIKNATINMINYTQKNSSALSNLGITIGSDYQLTIDESKFKAADMSKVKSMFHGSGSYANNVSSQASMIGYKTGTETSKSNTYTSSGSFSSTYSSGAMWDSFF